VLLVHWNAAEATGRESVLRDAGHDVDYEPFEPFPAALRRVKADAPDAFVIDLSRLPSHGRDVGLALREAKATRFVPIVFVGGQPEKIERTKQHLPDATYTTWPRIAGALRRALERPVVSPVVPRTRLDGYSGTPLPKKLGIKPGFVVSLLGAPAGFESKVELPHGASFRRSGRGRADLVLLFVRSGAELGKRLVPASEVSGGEIWVVWPKKTANGKSDVGQNEVRALGLASGLVDYKVAAIDEVWSGLRFKRRA
jgi:CheY-like chemotaxis protein